MIVVAVGSLLVGLAVAALAFFLQLDRFTSERSCMPEVEFVDDDPGRMSANPSCLAVTPEVIPLTALGTSAGLLTAAVSRVLVCRTGDDPGHGASGQPAGRIRR